MFSQSWTHACFQEGQSLRSARTTPVLLGAPQALAMSMGHTRSLSLAPQQSTHASGASALRRPFLQPCPRPVYRKGFPCPGCTDKYGNSIFIGCINISDLYIHFIHHSAGPEGRAKVEAPAVQQLTASPKALPTLPKPRPRLLLPLPPRSHCVGRGRCQEGRRLVGGLVGEDTCEC